MTYKVLPLLLSLLLPASFMANAQNSVAQKDSLSQTINHIKNLVVVGARVQTPYSESNRDVVILDAAEIKKLPVLSVNELLSYVAGVDVRQRGPWGGQADISINGGTFDETLILLNGIKIVDPQTGHNMMNLPVNPKDIERIEVLKGAAASACGINAMAGAINIITKQPKASGASVSLFSGSSFNRDTSNNKLYANYGIRASASIVGKKSAHFLSLTKEHSSGYRYNTALNLDKIYYQNHIKLGKGNNDLRFMGGFSYDDMGTNGFYAPPGDKESKETIQTGIAALSGDFKMTNHWTIRPSVSYRYGFDHYIFIRQHPSVYENLHFTNVVDATLNNTVATASGVLGFGLEYRYATINSNSLGDRNRKDFGLFAEYDFTRVAHLSIHPAVYLNNNPLFGWQFLPSIDAGYQVSHDFRVFASASTGIRLPTFTDWYYKGPANIGNPDLTPETSIQYSLGVKYHHHHLHLSASYFYRTINDFIDWTKDSLNAPWQPHNFQSIHTPGIALNARYRILTPKISSGTGLSARLSYTWLNPDIVIPDGDNTFLYSHYALENLKNQAIFQLSSNFLKYFNATITGRYEQRVNYKDYILVDAQVGAQWRNFDANLRVNNLTNVTYIETGAVPLPGRWFSLNLGWSFTRDGK